MVKFILGDEGQYAYFETTGLGDNTVTSALSSQLYTHDYCMSFWYHMYGINVGTLIITTVGSPVLFSKSGNQGDQWFNERISVYSVYGFDYRVCIFFRVSFT